MDTLSPEERSERMSRVRSKDTVPELAVRKGLRLLGVRYRLGGRSLPGRPDVVVPTRRLVIFVHGCFWHRHPRCARTRTPKSRVAFWQEKFAVNVERDRKAIRALRRLGWRVGVIWECETEHADALCEHLGALIRWADSGLSARHQPRLEAF